MTKDTLVYFDFAFWKAEVPRLSYFIAGIDFEDKRLTREEQQKMKASGELPFGYVPMLYVDGKEDQWLTQGNAIIRYVGTKTKLYPVADAWKAAKVDEVLNLVEEVQNGISPTMRESDEDKKMAMRKQLADEALPACFARFEKLLTDSSPYFVGGSLTVGDIAVWRALGWIKSGALDGIPTTVANDFPKLLKCFEAVEKNPKVVEWKAKHSKNY